MTDIDASGEWLDAWFRGAPGLVHLCSSDDWNGAAYDNRADALADVATRMSRNPQGIYFRVTTLAARPAPGKRGGADQSLALIGMHSDIDFGTAGHKHAGGENVLPLPPDETAAWAVAERSGLPTPSFVVNSGGGLNVYWKLREALVLTDQNRKHAAELSATWQAVLGESARKLDFTYGVGVGDLSRVLRLPGSDNMKTGTARPCRVVYGTGALYSIQELADAAAEHAPQRAATSADPRSFTPPPRSATSSTPRTSGQLGPFDILGEKATFADLLQPEGWSYVGSDSNGEKWLRPSGADGTPSSDYSARAYLGGKPVLVVHSESAGLPSGAGCDLTLGRVFAHLHHRGDEHAAAQDLIRAAAGDPNASLAARRLPAAVLTAIRDQCGVTPWTEPKRLVGGRQYVAAALRNELQRILDCTNDIDNQIGRSAYALGRFVAAGLLDKTAVAEAIAAAAKQTGIADRDLTHNAIRRGIADAARNPYVPNSGGSR